jgi:hypothetical protein
VCEENASLRISRYRILDQTKHYQYCTPSEVGKVKTEIGNTNTDNFSYRISATKSRFNSYSVPVISGFECSLDGSPFSLVSIAITIRYFAIE